jgi:hypothetical protein
MNSCNCCNSFLSIKYLSNRRLVSVRSTWLLEREDLTSALAGWTFASRLKGFSPP